MIRKNTLEFDNVINKQREEIYSFRNELLLTDNCNSFIEEILYNLCSQMANKFFISKESEGGWDPEGYRDWLIQNFPVTFEIEEFDDDYLTAKDLEKLAFSKIIDVFKKKNSFQKLILENFKDDGNELDVDFVLNEIVRGLLIHSIDDLWQSHLTNIDNLRTEVYMQSVGQKDPVLEFKHQAFALFDKFGLALKMDIAHAIFKFEFGVQQKDKTGEIKVKDSSKNKKKKKEKGKKGSDEKNLVSTFNPMVIDLSLMD